MGDRAAEIPLPDIIRLAPVAGCFALPVLSQLNTTINEP